EHYAPAIAAELRRRGHDAISVNDHADLVGLADDRLLAIAASELRAVVTENWPDFDRAMQAAAAAGADSYGVVFTSPKQLPRSKASIGLFVCVLGAFLQRNPADDALLNSYRWLPQPGRKG